MQKKRFFFFCIFTTSFLFWISCSNNMQEIRELTQQDDLPIITVQGMKSDYTVNSDLRVQLMTPLLYKFDEEKKSYFEFPKGLKINFYNKDTELESSLKADYGIYYEKKQISRAEKNVVLTNINGSILRTEELFLNEKDGKIYSVKPVTITYADGSVIQGEGGFESDLDFTVYRFTDVSGIQAVKDVLDK